MDMTRNKIVSLKLVQVTEVKNSNAMELEGLKHCLSEIGRPAQFETICLVTDQHPQVQKYIREHQSWITHFYDRWHVCKRVAKKLLALAARKGCELVGEWIRGIKNHIHWSAKSSNGDGELAVAKWLSIQNHLINKHRHQDSRFPRCEHGHLRRKWFKPGTAPYDGLCDIITDARLLMAIRKLSPHAQTSTLEVSHSAVNQFAP